MAEGWRRIVPSIGEAGARALIYRLGPDAFTDHALLGWARSWDSANDPAWRELATLPHRFTAPEFPLKAADFRMTTSPAANVMAISLDAGGRR